MTFPAEIAEIRFGCGLSPRVPPPRSAQDVLDALTAPDEMAQAFPVESFEAFRKRMALANAARKRRRNAKTDAERKEARKTRNLLNKAAREDMIKWKGQTILRWVNTRQGFLERLAFFWGDHFTAVGKAGLLRRATSAYVETAIRPNMTGSFSDLLIAAVTSPLMLHYLDQGISTGPNSQVAARGGRNKGLNENLAREVLELHTLGVDGPYAQDDVRQLAELFTGLTYDAANGFKYRKDMAEPGAETVLGKSYGGETERLAPVLQALRDLAAHPATARHIARKLAVHFVSDTPDTSLVDHLEARFIATGGQLLAVYEALLEHPTAWAMPLHNVKPPADFVASACRALDVQPEIFADMDEKQARRLFVAPMRQMGQLWQQPPGPDGWPEQDTAWITPQGVAARLRWAMAAPRFLRRGRGLPPPKQFVQDALGGLAPEAVRFAAASAESRSEAIGLVLSAPAFQRR